MRKIIFIILILHSSFFSIAQNWQGLSDSIDNAVRCLFYDSTENVLYVGGHFIYADTIKVGGVAKWNGVKWDSLAAGIGGNGSPILSIIRYEGEIYAGGFISEGVKKWNGTNWSSVGGGVNGIVAKLKIMNNELYVTGDFDTAGMVPANSIAKWNGISWSDVGAFPNYNFGGNLNGGKTLEVYKNDLYLGGGFRDSTGNIQVLAKWNGNIWEYLGYGVLSGSANALFVYNNELYVAAGGSWNYIARWNGVQWNTVGDGMNNNIRDFAIFNNELYAVGVFTYAGGVPAQYLAKWNSAQWCSLGGIFDNVLSSIGVYDSMLYIGGGFWTINGDSISYIAKWTGGNYVDTCGAITGQPQISNLKSQISVSPNPFTAQISVGSSGIISSIGIHNIFGQLIYQSTNLLLPNQVKIINLSAFPTGIYFLTATINEQPQTFKIIKM